MEVPSAFRFINLLGREYDDSDARVRGVTYTTSYFGNHDRTYHFPDPVTESAAIAFVEAALSKSMTLHYYTGICDDLLHTPRTWEGVELAYPARGRCLRTGDLRRVAHGPDGYLTLYGDE